MLYKRNLLLEKLSALSSVLVAFSGGTDSTFLLKAAVDALGGKCAAATIDAQIIPRGEIYEAWRIARSLGVMHIIIPIDIFKVPEFTANTFQRCYHCKKYIFRLLLDTAKKYNLKYVIEGTNADDTGDYRPGLRALSELGIISPLKEVGLTKSEIRLISRELNLQSWNKPPGACLATRFPYGEEITCKKLHLVESAEKLLFSLGFNQCRVRYHRTIARIEIPEQDFKRALQNPIRKKIMAGLESLGFAYVTLDIAGFRTGSLNKLLPSGRETNGQ